VGGSLEKQVVSAKLSSRIVLLRAVDARTTFFEGVWSIPEGVTYNSYLVFGDEKVVLLDTVRREFAEDFMEELRSHLDVGDIDAVVVHHAEQDHSGTLAEVLRAAPKAKVYASPLARPMLESFYGLDLSGRFEPVRSGYRLTLGGISLVFEQTPWLHWPETVMSLLEEEGTLFSGDAFGSYGRPAAISDGELGGLDEGYVKLVRKYFATVIGRYKRNVASALERLESRGLLQKVRRIAPLHGLVVEKDIGRVLSLYRKWAQGALDPKRAVVLTFTSYGTSDRAVSEAVAYLESRGLDVEVYRFDSVSRSGIGDVLGAMYDAGLVVVSASTYEADAPPSLRCLVDVACAKASNAQRVVVLSSYGWGGGGGRRIAERMKSCGFEVVGIVEYPGSRVPVEELRRALDRALDQLGR
jgi:flavorubredoxin